jgi:hypothetical protein
MAMLREVHYEEWIPRGMTKVCEPEASAMLFLDGDVMSAYIIHHTLHLITFFFKSAF